MTEPTTAKTHPFVLDLLAGWQAFIGDERYSEVYQEIIGDLYQLAGAETQDWGEPSERDLTLREQFVWLTEQMPGLLSRLEAIEGPIHTSAPVEDQDDDTPFDSPQDCEVILTDKVIQSALVFISGATSRQDAAEKARELAEADEVEWENTYESEGDVNVASVRVNEERGR